MKEYFEIVDIMGRRIFDAFGNETVETEITLDDGTVGRASVPACNDDPDNVNKEIAEALLGLNVLEQANIDGILQDVDGTEGCARLGAGNAMACSLSCAKAASEASGLSLFSYIGGVNARTVPLPMMDLYDDGSFYLIPDGADSFYEALCICRDAMDWQDDELPKDGDGYIIISAENLAKKSEFVFAGEFSTLTGLLDGIAAVRKKGKLPVLAASECESDEEILADIAVAAGTEFVCFGKPGRAGSSPKYNELLRIEEELSDRKIMAQWEN